jgi:hypothetical protein
MPYDEGEASWLPRISLGLTAAQLSERLRCAEWHNTRIRDL